MIMPAAIVYGMTTKHTLLLTVSVAGAILWTIRSAPAQTAQPMVRIAELTIDPAQLDAYRAALKEEIATSIRVEPGVLTLYAVSVKGRPEQVRLFETYADSAAYRAHLASAHFKKYKAATQRMVLSLTLVETDPILLGAKGR